MKFELGPGLKCDLQKLIDTRALIQANSGGGKSWVLRRLLEQTAGHVQQIVIDPEGEFSSLRERFDVVLAAKHGGDTAADPRSAKLLAERLLDLKVSAICDIYELKAYERIKFVRAFLEAMVDAPKALWHPALIVVDEAHVFCPQQGEAESAGAVIDMATRGRKRGFCLVAATQRLSKLHKDAAAELNNKLIGRTGLDVDRKRAGEELGFTTKEQLLALRQLEPGHFFAFGPALSASIVEVEVGPVQTSHPKAGSRIAFEAPPATDKIKALLPQLADLPAEAEQKAKSEADLRKELAAARSAITRLEHAAPVQTAANPELAAELRQTNADRERLARQAYDLTQAVEQLMKFILEINAQDFFTAGGEKIDPAAIQKAIDGAAQQLLKLVEADLRARRAAFEKWRKDGEQLLAKMGRLVKQDVKLTVAVRHNAPFTVTTPAVKRAPASPRPQPAFDGAFQPSSSQVRILNALSWLESVGVPAGDKTQVALLADQSPKSSTYQNNLGSLRSAGLVVYPGANTVGLTDAGRGIADPGDVPRSSEELHAKLYEKLPASQAAILKALIAAYPDELTKPDLADRAGASAASSTYQNNLGALRSLKLIDYTPARGVVAKSVLFLEGA